MLNIGDYIPVGYPNRVSREFLCAMAGAKDREIRKAIEDSDLPIINVDGGYFIPGDSAEDNHLAQIYVNREYKRIKTLKLKMDKKFKVFC